MFELAFAAAKDGKLAALFDQVSRHRQQHIQPFLMCKPANYAQQRGGWVFGKAKCML